jgi:hypothetical protein
MLYYSILRHPERVVIVHFTVSDESFSKSDFQQYFPTQESLLPSRVSQQTCFISIFVLYLHLIFIN